jgi:RHS repeat-associated protein
VACIGRLTRITDASGSTTYCYDRRGNVTQKKQSSGALTTVYTYTVADRLATMTYPSGAIVTYGRDVFGRVQTIDWKASVGATAISLINNATYYPFGPLNGLTFGNGRTLTKSYDQDYAIDQITSSVAGGLTLDFGVDVMGNITKASGTINPATPDRSYAYDPLYRLTSAQTGAASPLEAYTYNKTGDRLSAALNGGAAQAYTYAATTHHLASVGGTARTYDLNGNTKTGIGSGLTLAYDVRNRLSSGTKGTTIFTYTYNGRGERISKGVTIGGFGSGPTQYVYNEGGQLLGGYGGATAEQAEYVYLDSTLIAIVKAGVPYYVETDHLGTPRQIIDKTSNAAVWKWDSLGNTFGTTLPNQSPSGGAAFVMNLRFPGQYYDAESGLNYNYFRDYEPNTGRYVESDLIGLKGGLSTYAYVRANPLVMTDPAGLEGTGSWSYSPEQKQCNKENACAEDVFWKNYHDMINANWKNSDKYFHCKANCQATRCGGCGFGAACRISDMREWGDQHIKGDPASASAEDQVANHAGRDGALNNPASSCEIVCSSFRPPGLPPEY